MDTKEKKPPTKLETLGDVQRALSRLFHRVDRCKMNIDKARELREVLKTLAAVMQDKRDTRYQKRLKALWEAHERGLSPPAPEPDPSEH